MKRMKKVCAIMLGIVMLVGVTAFAAVSNSASQDGIQAIIQTDKNSYAANEEIQVNITVTNTNHHAVKNVSIEALLPDELTLKDGALQSDTVNLDAGETLTLSCTAMLEKEIITEPDTTEKPTETEPIVTEPGTTEEPTETEPIVTDPSTTEETVVTEPDTTLPEGTTSEPTTEEPATVEPTTSEPTTNEPTTIPGTTIPATEGPETTESTTDGGILLPVEPTTDRNSPSTTQPDSSTENSAVNPDTGDSSHTMTKVLACLAAAGAVVVAIVVMQKKNSKKATRVISLVLCGAIAISGIAATGFLSVSAEDDNSRSFTVQTVVTVDGRDYTLEGKVNYEVSATEEGDVKLYSDPKELSTSDAPQDVLFYIDTENTTGACDVTLFDAENGKKLAGMQDEGKNGDKIAGDGIYSTMLSVDCSEETTVQYYAVVDDGITKVKSKVREINIFAPMTDEEAENMEAIDNRLADLTESSEYVNASDDDKVAFMKQTLENMLDEGLITDYQFSNDDAMVSYTYPNGITAYWNVQRISDEYEYIGPTDILRSWDDLDKRNLNVLSPTEKKTEYFDEILFIYGWMDNYVDSAIANLARNLKNDGYLASSIYLPTVERYKELLAEKNYKYIVIAEHGGENLAFGFFYDSTYIATQERATKSLDEKYSQDLKGKKPRVIKQDGKYGIMPEFFSFYYENKLQDSIIDMQSCMGVGKGEVENYGFSSAFLKDCGASTYIGYHNSVYVTYTYSLTESILNSMVENKNIGEAYVKAVDYWGNNDIDYMYRHGYKSDSWLKPDESGKTLKEKVQEKEKNGETAYPVMTGSAKTTLNATVKFAGGNGSLNDPYQIATAQQLDGVRYHLDSNFVLVDDIDLSEYENWEPIGGYIDVEPGDGLQGSFDGQGHTISNLKMDYTITPTGDSYPSYYFGLFSDTTLSPGIKNVKLENVDINISGTGDVIGNSGSTAIYISGFSTNASVLSNINVSGQITASPHCDRLYVGGIANEANRIANSTNHIDINVDMTSLTYIASTYIGGVISIGGTILNNCSNYGNVYGEISNGSGLGRPRTSIYCGGIASVSSDAQITSCKNFGAIEGNTEEDAEVGGIVGVSSADNIALCSNYGVVSARSYSNGDSMVGGIIGNASSISRQGTVRQCANFGKITSICTLLLGESDSAYCGGITGNSWATNSVKLEECYNLASELEAVCRTSSEEKESNIGRISGVPLEYNASTNISNCYSLDSTLLNGLPAMDEIGPDRKNGGSMTRAEIEKAVTDLGFALPGQTE